MVVGGLVVEEVEEAAVLVVVEVDEAAVLAVEEVDEAVVLVVGGGNGFNSL